MCAMSAECSRTWKLNILNLINSFNIYVKSSTYTSTGPRLRLSSHVFILTGRRKKNAQPHHMHIIDRRQLMRAYNIRNKRLKLNYYNLTLNRIEVYKKKLKTENWKSMFLAYFNLKCTRFRVICFIYYIVMC